MTLPSNYKPVKGTEHIQSGQPCDPEPDRARPASNSHSDPAPPAERRDDVENGGLLRAIQDAAQAHFPKRLHGPAWGRSGFQLAAVEGLRQIARAGGGGVSNPERRAVVVRGGATAMAKAFAVELHDYNSPLGKYHGHEGAVNLPSDLADSVEAVIGLDNRQVPAKHFSTAQKKTPADPSNTNSLTPQQVARLYNFPAGDGTGQTIGIYEMQTQDAQGNPAPVRATRCRTSRPQSKRSGENLKVPKLIDVPVDGVTNSGKSDGETGLDITVAGAVAQGAKIAVYFTGGTSQSIIHALQAMIHSERGRTRFNIVSISYGWGPDDTNEKQFQRPRVYADRSAFPGRRQSVDYCFGFLRDFGAFIASRTQAQTSFPASDPWVTACGGTTIGNVNGTGFDEYVWNDSGATGVCTSARFPRRPTRRTPSCPRATIPTGRRGFRFGRKTRARTAVMRRN